MSDTHRWGKPPLLDIIPILRQRNRLMQLVDGRAAITREDLERDPLLVERAQSVLNHRMQVELLRYIEETVYSAFGIVKK